jgi:hypothetical protein
MRPTRDEPARLIHDHRVRVLNCSATGCLLETQRPLPVNTVATLQVLLGGRPLEDVVQIVRCQAIPEGGNVHHVATRFLSVAPLVAGSLRYLLRHQISELAGWLSEPKIK